MLVEINQDNIDTRLAQQAAELLREGGILIFPTDTVYAMGCDLYNKKACLLYTSPSPRDRQKSRMPSSA